MLGLNFISVRWPLLAPYSDGELACFPGRRMIPVHLRILFFALADVSDANAAESVWKAMGRRFSAAVRAHLVTPAAINEAVEAFLVRRCGGSAPLAPLLILVDELRKCSGSCRKVYQDDHLDAATAFRSECCRLANIVDGRALVVSLDDNLPTGETALSGRNTVQAAQLPLFPVVKLFEDVLLELSTNKHLHLNHDGQLVNATDDDGRRTLLADQAAFLAAIVGADARFASYLQAELAGTECGDNLHRTLTSAAGVTGVTCANVWAHPEGDIILAHAICSAVVVAKARLPSGMDWDAVRCNGFIQAIGGPEFRVRLPLYTLWMLTPAGVRHRPVYQA